jgi:hypothetical protein
MAAKCVSWLPLASLAWLILLGFLNLGFLNQLMPSHFELP